METFTDLKPFVDNHNFRRQREISLKSLNFDSIDKPILELIKHISSLDFCYTIQSCYGHFIYENQKDRHNISPLPTHPIHSEIEYRIAYLAFCLDYNKDGIGFLKKLEDFSFIDEHNIQFGCADWFWNQQVNTFVLQVEPERFKYLDKVCVDYAEALHLEKIRNKFFMELQNIISSWRLST
jgi:hypothetical protein